MVRLILGVIAVVACAWAALIFTGSGVLIAESNIAPAENYVVRSRGTPRSERQAKLVCRYFTGRDQKIIEFWHAPSGIGGLAACPRFASVSD